MISAIFWAIISDIYWKGKMESQIFKYLYSVTVVQLNLNNIDEDILESSLSTSGFKGKECLLDLAP